MDITVKIEGLKELEARLQEIDALGGKKLLDRVLRKIAKPMWQRAQANALSVGRSRALAASVKVVTHRRSRANVASTVVVTTKSKDRTALWMHNTAYKRERKGIFYGWMLDQGHRVGTRKTGWLRKVTRSTGGYAGQTRQVRPRLWWTPAIQATDRASIDAFVGELRKAIERMERRKSVQANPDALVTE